MFPFFSKALELVTATDIAELCDKAWPETHDVEFKMALPHKKGGAHPWLTGGDIGDHARDQILSEIVALANSQGGTLVLGIEETKEKPPRAKSISPLPRIGELARRLEDQARNCIDPLLPLLQIRPIETDGSDRGVIVFRTAASRNAPHRLNTTREFYKRHASSTQTMTAHEVQEMTLNVARGLAGVNEAFERRHDAFARWGRERPTIAAFRVTAIPITPLPDPGRLVGRRDVLLDYIDQISATVDGTNTHIQFHLDEYRERPILRGVARFRDWQEGAFRHETYQDGVIDFWLGAKPSKHPGANVSQMDLYHSHVLWGVLQVLRFLTRYRQVVGVPMAEYALEIEIARSPPAGVERVMYIGLVSAFGSNHHEVANAMLPATLPRIPIGLPDQFHDVLQLIHTDIYDALGIGGKSASRLVVTFNP